MALFLSELRTKLCPDGAYVSKRRVKYEFGIK